MFERWGLRCWLKGALVGCGIGATVAFGGEGKPGEYPLRQATEVTARGGLPNFFGKLKNGQPVRIGYLGGSITAQNGWRVLSRKWFSKRFPSAKVEEINAAIGGTGSNLGVLRLDYDVLQKKPDLLFVEFAVNDANASPTDITRGMEGIIRQTWKKFPETDICFVYTLTKGDVATIQAGTFPRSASVMEALADHYQIPTVHLGLEIARLEKEGKLVMSAPDARVERVSGDELNQAADLPKDEQGRIVFSKDGVHPYTDTGHALYMSALARGMDKIEPAGKPGAHTLPAPLDPKNWEEAQMSALSQVGEIIGGEKLDPALPGIGKNFSNRMPAVWMFAPGASLKFRFRGTKAVVYDIVGPGCGTVEVTLDGKSRKVNRIDSYCTYYRLATLNIADNLEPVEHSVEIKVLPDELDKKGILKGNAAEVDKDPAKFKDKNWYCGAVFVIGEILK